MDEKIRDSILDLLCETYRYSSLMFKMTKFAVEIQPSNGKRVNGAFNRINKKILEIQDTLGVEIITLSGLYQPELPVTPLNIDDFEVDDKLVIDEMIEPVIKEQGSSKVLRMGKVMLKKII